MQLLICAATELELATLKAAVARRVMPPTHHIRFLITGVGLGPAMYTLTKQLCHHRPDLVLQVGIAGALDSSLLPGDTVVVQTDTFADAGVEENKQFRNLFEMGFIDPDVFPWQEGFLPNPFAQWLALPNLPLVRGITVNEISTDLARIQQYRMQWGAQTESMEGAALHYVCLQEEIPFLQLRSISNAIGVRDKTQWKLKEAIQNLNTEFSHLLDKIMDL